MDNTRNISSALIQKLEIFYDSTRKQHSVSFWASIIASVSGLLVVIFSVIVFLLNSERVSESVILAISGVMAEFIGAIFLYIYNKNTIQVNVFFNNLIKLQDTELAIRLVEKMNEKNHDYMYMQIINILILRNEPQKDLSPELVRELRQSTKQQS